MNIKVSFTPIKCEISRIVWQHQNRMFPILMSYLLGAAYLLLGILELFSPDPSFGWYRIILGICALAVPFYYHHRMTKSYKSNRLYDYGITREGFTENKPAGERSLSWDDFEKWYDRPKAFILVTRRSEAIILPKRAFSDEDSAEFRKFLEDPAY